MALECFDYRLGQRTPDNNPGSACAAISRSGGKWTHRREVGVRPVRFAPVRRPLDRYINSLGLS
jgi:hypothetical protein